FFEENDIHIHVPAGAIPKDGPSAGVTMLTALASLLTGKTVKKELAMTGEITLRGRVLPVGGIKEKVLAAHRAGIKKLLIPKENKKDLEEIPANVRRKIDFVLVENMDEVLREALLPAEAGSNGSCTPHSSSSASGLTPGLKEYGVQGQAEGLDAEKEKI